MRELARKISSHRRLLTMVFLVSALVILGDAGGGLLREHFAENSGGMSWASTAAVVRSGVDAGESETSQSGDRKKMAPDGKAKATPSGCALSAIILQTDNSNSKLRMAGRAEGYTLLGTVAESSARIVLTRPGEIHSGLSRQATLVGAKPSGTS